MFKSFVISSTCLVIFSIFCYSETGSTSNVLENETHLYPVTVDGKLGYIDKTGKIIIEPQFQSADRQDIYVGQFSEGLAFVRWNDKFGYIDMTGKIVIETQFDKGYEFSEGIARVKIDKKYGYIDKTGKFVIDPEFKKASDFSEGLAAVKSKGKWVYINKKGKVIINNQYDYAKEFYDGLAWVKINKKWSCIDKQGNIIFKSRSKDPSHLTFHEGLSRVKKGKYCRYIDKTGKKAINEKFNDALIFTEGLAGVSVGGKYKKISKGMRVYIGDMLTKEYGYWVDDKWGYIDKTGKFVIEPRYDQAYPFSNGLAAVVLLDNNKDYKVGYIDKTGKYVIEPFPANAGSKFNDEGIAQISIFGKDKKGSFKGYINTKGEYIWKPSR